MVLAATDVAPPPAVAALPAPLADYDRQLTALQARLGEGACSEVLEPLKALAAAGHDDNQLLFLIGMASLCHKDYRAAIIAFRTILARDPDVVRVRLELGRAYFEKGEWANAQRQFSFARAGHNPPSVTRNIDRYLYAIRRKKPLTASFGLAVAPDSNLNAGPSVSTLDIYGVPYTLNAEARPHSGLGVAVEAAVNWGPHLGGAWRWDVSAAGHTRRYRDGAFDDTDLGVTTGPHLVLPKLDLALHGTLARRWFGGSIYVNAWGGTLDAVVDLDGRDALAVSAARSWLDYPSAQAQTGPVTSASLGVTRLLTPSSSARLTVSHSWTNARDDAFSATTPGVELSGQKEFRGGFSATATYRLARAQYGYFAAFASRRHDWQHYVELTLLHRRLSYHGFAPRLSLELIANRSNLPAWSFTRKRCEVGFTRTF